ncbi:hypothetical protein [Budvicia aquatica]|uniref:Lipoprotein n=1 Tax=Budvicia aquatica TaxID=82979 RepID=A0A2C6DEV6_9GAMM|nr:hypothetical protein [Budvicia aquatica]PHI29726.1 hypothetical protein CRN84_10445 [Budvicia aquatica]
MRGITCVLVLVAACLTISGCARPFGPTPYTFDQSLLTQKQDTKQSKITVHRSVQVRGNLSGDNCKTLVFINDTKAAALAQNKYVVLYLDVGEYKLRVTGECNPESEWFEMGQILHIVSDGSEQVYETEVDAFSRVRMSRTH